MRESVSEKRQEVDRSLMTRGLMGRVERFWASDDAQVILTTAFTDHLQALKESAKGLPACYSLAVQMVFDAKAGEAEGFKDAVSAIFRFRLDESVNRLAEFMPVDSVLPVLADETTNNDFWIESLKSACKEMSAYIQKDFCEKVLVVGMPASKTKNDLKHLVEQMAGELLSDDDINHLWLQHVVLRGMTGVLR